MVSSKKPAVNRRKNKHSQLVLSPGPGETDFRRDTNVDSDVHDDTDPDHVLNWVAKKARNSDYDLQKLKLTLKADNGNRVARRARGSGRGRILLDPVPAGTLIITLTNYPNLNTSTTLDIPVEYVDEDQP